ncbi:hypothetical protein SEI61121_11611 [Salmonella enterica subsp. indica serovar 6,14,25:z10:1,(2),7 str. 1121]|uniref:Uncharacterized protein n=1 Tax=Salmonella enterica subsp. indica serovar 6,14,25:z10:1,(2),7 str. 1121 TaxID=1173950 RepID=V1H428_SALER|nr:hypothetical protein SEI61121_11611 [Salmonella enterica subsp. indica serovar 6,14,25:z10:1,(2),7 str. 1121]
MRKEKMAALCRHKNVQILKFRLYLYYHQIAVRQFIHFIL